MDYVVKFQSTSFRKKNTKTLILFKKMEKFRAYGQLGLALVGAFNLGAYTFSTIHGMPIEPHRWVMTSLFTLFFSVSAVVDLKKL